MHKRRGTGLEVCVWMSAMSVGWWNKHKMVVTEGRVHTKSDSVAKMWRLAFVFGETPPTAVVQLRRPLQTSPFFVAAAAASHTSERSDGSAAQWVPVC